MADNARRVKRRLANVAVLCELAALGMAASSIHGPNVGLLIVIGLCALALAQLPWRRQAAQQEVNDGR